MKYRKKPIEVEAFYLTRSSVLALPMWASRVIYVVSLGTQVSIDTKGGYMVENLPVWIIREPDGKGCYPCSPERFDKLFERVE